MNPQEIGLSSKFRKILNRFCGIRFLAGFGVTFYAPGRVTSLPADAGIRVDMQRNNRFVFNSFVRAEDREPGPS
jgi:hypothetical protein